MRTLSAALLACWIVLPAAPPAASPELGGVAGTVVVTRRGQPVAREFVYVYLEPRHRSRVRPTPRRAKISQRGQRFSPRVQVVPLRSTVDFPNDDNQPHNVFSPTEPRFDLRTYPSGQSRSRVFDFEGEYAIYCDIHQNMTARVKVVDSDYIARVDRGAFALTGVPAGRYKLHVWTPENDEVIERVTVTAATVTRLAAPIKLPLKPATIPAHHRMDGSAYSCKYNTARSRCLPPEPW